MIAAFSLLSVSELELNHGLLRDTSPDLPEPDTHGYWVQRHIDDLEERLRDTAIKDYLDMVPSKQNMDPVLCQAMDRLKEDRLSQQVQEAKLCRQAQSTGERGKCYVDRVSQQVQGRNIM